MTSTVRGRGGHPARARINGVLVASAEQERWVGSPDALTETAAERRLLSPSAEIALAHFYPRQLVELSGFSRFERSAGSTGDSSSEADGGLP